MHRLLGCLFAVLCLELHAQSPGGLQQDLGSSQWRVAQSPTRASLASMVILDSSHGYVASSFLLEYQSSRWILSSLKLPAPRVARFFAAGKSRLWMTSNTVTNESELFSFNGLSWQPIRHPFANEILSMFWYPNGTGWIAGWGEIAYYNGIGWTPLSYPDSRQEIVDIQPDVNQQLWCRTSDLRLFLLADTSWIEQRRGEPIFAFTPVSDGSLVALSQGKVLRWVHGAWHLHSQDSTLIGLKDLAALSPQDLWCVGDKGSIVHYTGNRWQRYPSPVTSDLTQLQMINSEEGWAIGNYGTILHYSRFPERPFPQARYGFDLLRVYPFGREADDEYGVAIDDIDGDGRKDIYAVCIFNPRRLYINKGVSEPGGSLQFSEEAVARGVTGVMGDATFSSTSEIYLGLGLADIDNDGDLDLYLCDLQKRNKLFLNDGSGFFRYVSGQPNRGVGTEKRTNAVAFSDVDQDGDLDLFIANEKSTSQLFLNNGNGYFEDVTARSGLRNQQGGMCATFADIDGDGDQDLCVTHWLGPNKLYRNDCSPGAEVRFTDITDEAGIGGESSAKNNAAVFADIDNDGDLDLFITKRKLSNRLYINNGKGIFTDKTAEIIGLDSLLSYGASFADFNHDGFLDLYVANVGDNVLYKNVSGKRFVDATDEFGARLGGYSTGTAVGDIDNDGDVDMYVANYLQASSMLYLNNVNDPHFLTIRLEGVISNRDAVGAKVWLYAAGHAGEQHFLRGYREVISGSGYGSRSSLEIHFGTDTLSTCDLVVLFPVTGIRHILSSISPSRHLLVRESEGITASWILTKKAFNRLLIDPEVHLKLLSLAVIVFLMTVSVLVGQRRYQWALRTLFLIHGLVLVTYLAVHYALQNERWYLAESLPLLLTVLILFISHLVYHQVIAARQSRQEKQAIRDHLARDLHDDLAATLNSGLIYADILKRIIPTRNRKQSTIAVKIHQLLIEASDAITDIVWAVSPSHDSFSDLLARIRLLITGTCKVHGMTPDITLSQGSGDFQIPDELRRNIYLIFKEGMQNIVRHAGATRVLFSVQSTMGGYDLILEDDGRGIDPSVVASVTARRHSESNADDVLHGHGINNMLRRAAEIHAAIRLQHREPRGTRITLGLSMTHLRY